MGVRRLLRPAAYALSIYGVTFCGVVAVELFWSRDVPQVSADTIVCLGGGAKDDRLEDSSAFRARQCIAVFEAGAAPRIMFTGTIAAPLMADLARARGVPEDAILVEEASRSTLQNALFTSEVIGTDGTIIVVTDAFHLPRSWVSFRVMGFEDQTLVASRAPNFNIKALAREALALWFNAGRVALWWATPWLPAETRAMLLI